MSEYQSESTINPTNENLAKHCFEALTHNLNHPLASVQSITVWESEGAGVTYRKEN